VYEEGSVPVFLEPNPIQSHSAPIPKLGQ